MKTPPIDELLAALERSPADRTLRAVCADALVALDEPQGTLIAYRLAGVLAATDARWLEEELGSDALQAIGFEKHSDEELKLSWRDGFIDGLSINFLDRSLREFSQAWKQLVNWTATLPAALANPVEARVARLLRCLRFVSLGPFDYGFQAAWDLFRVYPPPPWVKRFAAGFERRPGELHKTDRVDLGEMRDVWPAFSQLESLAIHGLSISLGDLSLPRATSFELNARMTPENFDEMCSARWPRLERLALAPGAECDLDEPEVTRFLRQCPKTVRQLVLQDLPSTADALEYLATEHEPLLRQLKTLDVSFGGRVGDGAVLLRHAHAFAHLDVLNVYGTGLIPTDALLAAVPTLTWHPAQRFGEYG